MHPVLRLIGIVAVFIVTAVAWVVLGGVTSSRGTEQRGALYGQVADLWGSAQTQVAPTFALEWTETVIEHKEQTDANGFVYNRQDIARQEARSLAVDPSSTRADVKLHLDQRRKGLLWFPLYDVAFDGTWTVENKSGVARNMRLTFPFPDREAMYDDFHFALDGVDQGQTVRPEGGAVTTVVSMQPGQILTLGVHYTSRGADQWVYKPSADVGQIEDFKLTMSTDFDAIDFPALTLSPSNRVTANGGWSLDWTFARLVSGYGIGMVMPTHIQPGELASDLSFSAPLSLGLFFLWIYVLGLLRGTEIHPVNYLMIAAAFFSFNLLFAYTADHLAVEAAFALASVVSVGLVASYLRLVVGARFALVEAGLAQVMYQVGFGIAHFTDGYTGLAITVMGIITLFALMQLTGRISWSEKLGGRVVAKA